MYIVDTNSRHNPSGFDPPHISMIWQNLGWLDHSQDHMPVIKYVRASNESVRISHVSFWISPFQACNRYSLAFRGIILIFSSVFWEKCIWFFEGRNRNHSTPSAESAHLDGSSVGVTFESL